MSTINKWLLFVGLPVLLCLFYFALWASDMYISEAKFSLRSPEKNQSIEWLALFGQASGGTGADAYVIQEYLASPALLEELDRELGIRTHYQNPEADYFSRLGSAPTREEFIDYFQKQVSLNYDQVSGILTLQVRAFTPEVARNVCSAILNKSEALVNSLRDRAIEDSLALTRAEVARAEQRLTAVQQAMRLFRQQHNLLDPRAEAGSLQGLVAELKGSAAKARTELTEARSYMQEDSARVVSLKSRVRALEEQINAEKTRLAGKGQEAVSSLAAEYEQLSLEHEFAQKQYLSAITSIETARIHAESQSRYLVAFIEPTLPDEALWPRRAYAIGISFAVILLVFGLGSLIIAAIREHAGV